MIGILWALDGLLVFLLLALAARVLTTRDLFEATVLFIAFGLTLALTWARLGAPDLALAEAALGAGVTGALLLNAFHRLARQGETWEREPGAPDSEEDEDRTSSGEEPKSPTSPTLAVTDTALPTGAAWLRPALLVTAAFALTGLTALLLRLPERAPLLPSLVAERLGESGVSNPVTAVLLNFRAYDTLLEVAVLVVAMVVVWSLDRGSREFARDPEELREDPVLESLTRLVVPLVGVTAVYLVWAGSYAPAGAFQAGALLAGAGVLLVAAGILRPLSAALPTVRFLGVLALAVFVAVGLAALPWTGTLLAYPEGTEYGIILLVEALIAISVAVILVELFVDVPAVPEAAPQLAEVDPTGDPLGRVLSADGATLRRGREDE